MSDLLFLTSIKVYRPNGHKVGSLCQDAGREWRFFPYSQQDRDALNAADWSAVDAKLDQLNHGRQF